MTIEIKNPEVERIVNEAVLSGRYSSAQDVLSEAVLVWRSQQPAAQTVDAARQAREAKNLFELFAPIRGLLTDEEIDRCFSRNPSTGRPVDLS